MFGREENTASRQNWDFKERYAEWLSEIRAEARPVRAGKADGKAARLSLQAEAVRKLMKCRRLLVQWGTGTGKSRVGIEAAVKLMRLGRKRILLLVAEDAHKENWRRECQECLGPEKGNGLFAALTVECYQSLRKYEGTQWDLVIADEAHHLRSEMRQWSIASFRSDYVLCLSATISDRGDGDAMLRTLAETFGPFKSMELSTQDAIDRNIIAVPTVHVHVLALDRISTPQTVEIPWGGKNDRSEFDCDISEYRALAERRDRTGNALIRLTATAKDAYEAINGEMQQLRWDIRTAEAKIAAGVDKDVWERREKILENRYVNMGGRRKQLLGHAKTLFAEGLIRRLGGKRMICFCTSIEQGEALGGEFSVHSRRKDNDELILGFNRKDHDQLFAVGMMKEGQNLDGIEAGFIIQLGGKERTFIQEFGRVLRAGKPEQHVIVIDRTNDVEFFFYSLKNVNPNYVKVHYYLNNNNKTK